MQYPLEERIGHPDLFIGRKKEMTEFHKWLNGIPNRLSKSRAILARKKSGKTAFVQRIFNQLWSENGRIIPFYYEIRDQKTWYPDLAFDYYRHFASQYISFLERDPTLVRTPLKLNEIRDYGKNHGIPLMVSDVDELKDLKAQGSHDRMWWLAMEAPHHFAGGFDKRILVILDEFQNINHYIYLDEAKTNRDETLAGSYHEHSESKVAPMLVTGSYVGWLVNVINTYLEAGRLKFIQLSPYLAYDEGLEAVYKYAEMFDVPITNETAILINQLCFSDPFFISCVVQSVFDERNLTTAEGVAATVQYELEDRNAEMARTWADYINLSVSRINSQNAKNILLHLSKYPDREWTHLELKKELHLDLEPNDILRQLEFLSQADLIQEGRSDIAFRGLNDGTLHLILRNRFEQEISSFEVNLKKEFLEEIQALKKKNRSLQGQLNQLSGRVAEDQLATDFRRRGQFAPSIYFEGIEASEKFVWTDVRTRWRFQREDGTEMEIDVKAESESNTALLIEVKKTKAPVNKGIVETFLRKTQTYAQLNPEQTIITAILGLGGFTEEANSLCKAQGVGIATEIHYVQKEWS